MNLELERNKTGNYKQWIFTGLKCILFAVCIGILTSLTHMICSRYILHVHGKPKFLSNSLIIFSACSEILAAIGYLVLGYKIPIKNPILWGITYAGFNWASNLLPQFMGLAFADGLIAQQAFVMSDLACDTIVKLFSGVLLGMLFFKLPYDENSSLNKNIYLKPVVISAVAFPLLVIILDKFMIIFFPACSSIGALQVSEQVKMSFAINFYSWFILSGALISVLYQLTDYCDKDNRSWFKFAMKYSLLLWTPVVMIMVLFGTEIIATSVFDLLFIINIIVLSWTNSRLLKEGRKDAF